MVAIILVPAGAVLDHYLDHEDWNVALLAGAAGALTGLAVSVVGSPVLGAIAGAAVSTAISTHYDPGPDPTGAVDLDWQPVSS